MLCSEFLITFVDFDINMKENGLIVFSFKLTDIFE